MNAKKYHGSSFDNFLQEEGILEEIEAKAIKQVLAMLLEKELDDCEITRTKLAKKMKTSRSAVNRLLDPENTAVTLATIVRAGVALGRKVELSFR